MIERKKKHETKIFWGVEDDTENEQEDLEEKLKYVEEDIVKLRNKNGELKSDLNYELEEKESLKEKLDEAKENQEIMNKNLKKKIQD